MVVSETDVQASNAMKPRQYGIRGAAMLVAAGWLLTGCSPTSSMNPVNWWHQQQGGEIAKQRPPPPGADQPYPNLATVPAKPTPPNQEEMKQLTASLVADRTNAQHAAEAAPLADPSSPTASPNLFGVGTAPPPPPPGATAPSTASSSAGGSPGAPVASASMPAVTAPPAPPSPAPRKAVQSTPLQAPPAQSAPPQTMPAASAGTPAGAVATTAAAGNPSAGPPPPLPADAPPRPAAAGPPPVPPVVPVPMPAPPAGVSTTIVFVNDASNLTPPAADEVKAFAAKRGNDTISVIGYGDATSSDPDAQSAALNLGLSRAQSIVDALKADGVPGTAIRVSAEASGRGASLQLLH